MNVRRVVTGHDKEGKAVVVSDDLVQPGAPDHGQKWSIWGADAATTFPNDGSHPPFTGPLLPQPGGYHVTMFTLPAHFNPDKLFPMSNRWIRHKMFKAVARCSHEILDDSNPPGAHGDLAGSSTMHATATIDCIMQVSGESVLVLEDSEVKLKPSDWVVVNGVVHSWRNDGNEEAVLVGVVYGAKHTGVPLRNKTAA